MTSDQDSSRYSTTIPGFFQKIPGLFKVSSRKFHDYSRFLPDILYLPWTNDMEEYGITVVVYLILI